jgi:hypothetical protein
MRFIQCLCFLLITNCTLFGQIDDYKTKRLKLNPRICEIPTTQEVNHHHVPYIPRARNIDTRSTEVIVRYEGTVPQAAKTAMNEVTRIITELFPTEVPIIIQMRYTTLGTGTLAGASPTGWYSDFRNVPKFRAPYPVSLAEKIAKRQLNDPNEADISISVNQDQEWYYDFNNPGGIGNKFDFVSVILHEVLHGLGFSAITAVDGNGLGYILLFTSNTHTAYVDFLQNGAGIKLVENGDSTTVLGSELTSNNLFFQMESGPEKHKIYAPAVFSGGSSISHLDETTFNNTPNSLMTPNVSRGEIEGDPGIATDILYDLGWNFTNILHSQAEALVETLVTEDFDLFVEVESDSEIKEGSLMMHFSSNAFTSESIDVPMTLVGGNTFSARIPAPGKEQEYSYYFTVEDSRGMMFSEPGVDVQTDKQVTFSYYFGLDRVAPLINHIPIVSISNRDRGLDIVANVSDAFTGVDTVFVEWKINDEAQPPVGLILDTDNLFEEDSYLGRINFNTTLTENDKLEYRLIASDSGAEPNFGRKPRGELFYRVVVVPVLEPVLTYANDFDVPTEDFGGDFIVASPLGFVNPGLHSPHPYQNAGEDNTIDYVTELKIPIIVDNEFPFIEFDEVVLVEPGEDNTTFGQAEFWDYVIVEARELGGSNWIPLLDGYDSKARTQWLSNYNAGIGNGEQNSSASGNSSLFFNRTIDITEKGDFVAGDTITIRFRLFSDPFAVGWGWAIDNLKIQQLAVSAVDVELDNLLQVYPNPSITDEIFVKIGKDYESELEASIFTIDGKLLSQLYLSGDRAISFPYEKGSYLIRIRSEKGIVTRKIIKL